MKLAFSTLGCADRNLEDIIHCAERFGIRGIEVRGVDGAMKASNIVCFSPENAQSSRQLLTQRQIELICFGTSCSFHAEAKTSAMLAEGRDAVDLCRRMHISAIRVFGNSIGPHEHAEEVIQRVSLGIDKLCEYAATHGISVLLEVHGDFNRAETLMPVLQQNKKHHNFGLIWDVAHSDRVYGDDWRSFYDLIKPYIRHIHIKDCIRAKNGAKMKLTLIGEGEIPLRSIVSTLKKDGYGGWYSLEWEKHWVPELPEIEASTPGFIKLMENC